MIKLYEVPDYEHNGDLDYAEQYLRELCSEISIIDKWEERDLDAEEDYMSEYGECDESIYKGFIRFSIPDDKAHLVDNIL